MDTRDRFTIIRGGADTKERSGDESDDGLAATRRLIAAVRASPQFRQVDPHPHLSLVRRDDG